MWFGSPFRVGADQPEPAGTEAAYRAGAHHPCLPGRRSASADCQTAWHRPNTVSKWRIRFARQGLEGLADAPRSGKPTGRSCSPCWNAAAKGPSIVGWPDLGEGGWGEEKQRLRAVANDGVQLRRTRSWCVDRSAVCRQSHRHHRLVCGAAAPGPGAERRRKPSIQALSRRTGYVRTSSRKIVRRLKSTSRRNGTLNLPHRALSCG